MPVALNSGLYWPRRSFRRNPGTVLVEVLDPIPLGLENGGRFSPACKSLLEEATARLVGRRLTASGS